MGPARGSVERAVGAQGRGTSEDGDKKMEMDAKMGPDFWKVPTHTLTLISHYLSTTLIRF